MTNDRLAGFLQLKTVNIGEIKEVTGVYAGDLLSRTVSRAGCGNIWITAVGEPGAAVAAHLAGVSCIVVADGAPIDPELVEKAKLANIYVFSSKKSIADLTVAAARILKKETEAGAWNRILS